MKIIKSERRKMVQEFCFPSGVHVAEVKTSDSMSEAEKFDVFQLFGVEKTKKKIIA